MARPRSEAKYQGKGLSRVKASRGKGSRKVLEARRGIEARRKLEDRRRKCSRRGEARRGLEVRRGER
jgi:hypothetical protein